MNELSGYKQMKRIILSLVISTACLPALQASANPIVDNLLQKYQQQGAVLLDPVQGKKLWNKKFSDRSCTSCHGDSPVHPGKHVKTGKLIKPMSASVNSKRFQDVKKIEKWFLRNCKWTLGRQCTVQEKADILSWLNPHFLQE